MKSILKFKFFFLFYNIYILIRLQFNFIIYNEIKLEKYLQKCNLTKLVNEKYVKISKKPKVSIISPIYNREKYLIRFINSIQQQKFNNIEIILIFSIFLFLATKRKKSN